MTPIAPGVLDSPHRSAETEAPEPAAGSQLGALRLALFSIATLAIGGAQTAVILYLPAFYAQQFGLSLGLLGTIFGVVRLWNAFSDPLVGILSDRTHTRLGQRKPWVVAGGALFFVATIQVFMPSASANATYLTVWLFALYLGLSMMSTPLYAWSGNLTTRYHGRTRIQTFLVTVTSLGVALVLVIPLLLDRFAGANQTVKIASMGWFIAAALGVGIPVLLFGFRERPAPTIRSSVSFGAALRLLATDRLVLRVIGSDLFVSLGQGSRGSVFVLFVLLYMKLPPWAALAFPLIQYGFGVLAAPIWMRVGYRLGKSRTLIVGEMVQIAICLSQLLLLPGQLWPLAFITAAQGLCQGSGNLMLRAIISDVADQERLKTGKDHSGLLFSIFNVTVNAGMALALAMALHLVGLFGFQPGAANSPEALNGLRMVISLAPALGHGLSALLMWRFPLDEKRQAEIVRELERRSMEPAT